jgi:hypothetical protein
MMTLRHRFDKMILHFPMPFRQFIPTSSSWLNMVERWFREITDKRLRRGTFANVRSLIQAINDYIQNHNQNPQAFVWTATAATIMKKIAKCKEAFETLHLYCEVRQTQELQKIGSDLAQSGTLLAIPFAARHSRLWILAISGPIPLLHPIKKRAHK